MFAASEAMFAYFDGPVNPRTKLHSVAASV
jgi:hypothetical protein